MSLFDLSGKSAIITGSSRGIGRAIAEAMADQGAKVTISSRKPGPCQEVAAAINEKHGDGTAIAVPANISSKEELQAMVDATNKAFGKIDVVVCNAAANPYYGPMEGITDDQFEKVLQNNIISNHWLIQMCMPQMRERKDGAIWCRRLAACAVRRSLAPITSPRPRTSSLPATWPPNTARTISA